MQSSPPATEREMLLVSVERTIEAGDHFGAFVGRQSRFAFRVAFAVLRNVEDAEDAVQEAFLKLYRAGTWQSAADERAFVARTVWRTAIDRRPRSRQDALEADLPANAASPEESTISADWNATVHRLIDALPEQLRQPLALSAIEEMNSAEIAGLMGIPEGTVRTRLMRARAMLKGKLMALRGSRDGK